MAERTRPVMVATRVTTREKHLVLMAAEKEGVNVSELVHSIVIPEVRKRLVEELGQDDETT